MPKPVIPIKPPYTPELLPVVRYAIEGYLADGGDVFEYGSGYSTLWFSEFADVVSVEDDAEWYDELKKAMKREKVFAAVRFVDPTEMAAVIDEYDLFDLVLVDCRDDQRIPGIKHARTHVKPGGWLLLDDSHWPDMAQVGKLLPGWHCTTVSGQHKRHWTHHGEIRQHQTCIYTKP